MRDRSPTAPSAPGLRIASSLAAVAIATATTLSAGVALAQTDTEASANEASTPRQIEVTPFYGYQWGGGLAVEGGEATIPGGPSYGVILGMRVRPDAKAEFLYSREETSLEFRPDSTGQNSDLGDLAVQYFQLGGLVELKPGRTRPFVSGTLGLTWFDPTGDRSGSTKFSGGLGLGIHTALTEKLGLRLEGKGWLNFFNGSGSIFCGSGGCFVQGSASVMTQGEVLGGISVGL